MLKFVWYYVTMIELCTRFTTAVSDLILIVLYFCNLILFE